MKTSIKVLVLAIALIVQTGSAWAQTATDNTRRTHISVEIDPSTFVFGGYSAHVRIQPKSSNHFLFGAGIYAMDMPDIMVNLDAKNKDLGWKVRIDQGLGLFFEHHFAEVNKRWFVGAQTSLQKYGIENKNFAGSEQYTNALLMGYGGYTFSPFAFPLYIKAWGGIGYSAKLSGSNVVSDQVYNVAPISGFATVHLGYTF